MYLYCCVWREGNQYFGEECLFSLSCCLSQTVASDKSIKFLKMNLIFKFFRTTQHNNYHMTQHTHVQHQCPRCNCICIFVFSIHVLNWVSIGHECHDTITFSSSLISSSYFVFCVCIFICIFIWILYKHLYLLSPTCQRQRLVTDLSQKSDTKEPKTEDLKLKSQTICLVTNLCG